MAKSKRTPLITIDLVERKLKKPYLAVSGLYMGAEPTYDSEEAIELVEKWLPSILSALRVKGRGLGIK